MKTQSAVWIQDFDFKDTQRAQILKAWPRKQDKDAASAFLDEIRPCISIYLSMPEIINARGRRDRLNVIIKHSEGLIKSLDTLPGDIASELDALVKENLYFSSENIPIARSLKSASEASDEYPSIVAMSEIIKSWLGVLIEESKKIAAGKDKAGKNKNREIDLVRKLASIYSRQFKKAPSSSNNSNFRHFISELSAVLKIEIGADVVKYALKA